INPLGAASYKNSPPPITLLLSFILFFPSRRLLVDCDSAFPFIFKSILQSLFIDYRLPTSFAMAPKAAEKKPSTGGKAPAGKAPAEKKEAGKKTAAAASGEK